MNRLHTLMRINRSNSGYIAILLCICIPVLLLGVKHVIDTASFQTTMLTKSSGKLYKKCAKEAVLEVAKKWNSGLTLKEQKESMLRIADEVYNSSPTYHDSVVGQSIPGLDVIDIKAERGKMYDPLSVRYTTNANADSNSRVVEYKQVAYNKQRIKYNHTDDKAIANVSLLEPYRRLYFLIKKPYAILEDPCWDFVSYTNSVGSNQNTYSFSSFYVGADQSSNIAMNYVSGTGVSSVGDFYTARVNANDDKVQLSVENDKIKVITDDDIGYAIPAECNVDIILSIPTNGAACNKDNHDSSSITVGSPTVVTSDTVGINNSANLAARSDISNMRNTPIYQVAQAYRKFLHDNFKYTRGVNVGVIPYSGKLSIPPDKGTVWTEYIPKFISTYFFSDQNAYQAYIRGAFLYSTSGSKGGSLTSGYGNWGEYGASAISGGYSIMCRGKTTIEETYGKNQICIGDLLSTTNPATYKFRRMNYNPCYLGHANFLSMKCDSDCTKYYHNPYFVTELISDVEKVYDLLNAIVPINDPKNVSNFVFLPITWANNLFQSWSNDPKKDAINTVGSDISGGQLSHQSKGTSGRKKALILLVNKPDYFEHGELTYLGFNNDFSEIPLIESDCIRFDIDYSDNSKYFADGTKYNGSIQGAKKILKYETTSGTLTRNTASGYYETSSAATGKLSFPQKYLLKLVVEPNSNRNISWETKNISNYGGWSNTYAFGKYFIVLDSSIVSSSDLINWSICDNGVLRNISSSAWRGITYGKGKLVAANFGGKTASSIDGNTWNLCSSNSADGAESIIYDSKHDHYIIVRAHDSSIWVSEDASTWQKISNIKSNLRHTSICYNNGIYITPATSGQVYASTDLLTWSRIDDGSLSNLGVSNVYDSTTDGNKCYVVCSRSNIIASSEDGIRWKSEGTARFTPYAITYIHEKKQLLITGSGSTIQIGTHGKSVFQFTNISSYSNVGVTSNIYEPTARQEFYIEPSQISDSKDANGNYYIEFNMNNIRLISAEITNRPYKKIIPNCYLEGTTNGTGTAYIYTNVKKPLTIKAKAFPAEGTITFYNDNGIEDNVGTHKIINEQTFVFSGGQLPSGGYSTVTSSRGKNFGNNLSKYKVRYLSEDTKIVSATISSQLLRDYGSQYNRDNRGYKQLILNNGMLAKNTQSDPRYTSPYTFGSSAIADPEKYISYFRDSCISLISYVAFAHESGAPEFRDGDVCWKTYGVSGNIRTYFLHWFWYSYSNTAHGLYTCSRNSNYEGNCLLQMYIKNDVEKTLIPECNIEKNEGIDLLYTNGLNSIPEGNYICFQGDGELHVTVKSIASAIGTIKYTKADVSGIDSYSVTTSDSYTTFTIDPTTHLYEPLSDGTYRIKLDLNNVQITDPQMVDTNVVFEYTKLRLPEMSRTVDFSKNIGGKPVYDNNLIVYGENESGNFTGNGGITGLTYDSNLNYWITCKSDSQWANGIISGWHHCYLRGIIGDFFINIEDIGTAPPALFLYETEYPLSDDSSNARYRSGSVLHFTPFKYFIENNLMRFTLHNVGIGAKYKAIMLGFTFPINTALYYGADGTTLNKYQWQMNQNNSLEIDPNIACSRVTTDACKKLKQDWGNNLRIYVIKYRKQTNYKHKVRGTVKNFDYSYIDQCASDPSYVYDVSNDQNLKDTLQSIADNIKTFAGYQGAKNVE